LTSQRDYDASPASGPTAIWLAAGLMLSGMGTVILGPILPTLSQQWHLPDYQAGLLLFAKFIGSFVGGSTVPNRLRNGIFIGLIATCTGLTGFAYSFGLVSASLALFVTGIGLGQLIASTNILAGRRYRAQTGSALTILNFFWSLGAVAVGALIAALLPHHTLRQFLLTFAAAFIVIAVGGRLRTVHPATPAPLQANAPATYSLARQAAIGFGLMLFLYGGLETCLSQWITTYTVRYTGGHVLGGQSAIVVLWTALTVGRLLTSLVLRKFRESTVQRAGLLSAVLMIPIIANCNSAKSLSVACVLLGLSLSPVFPVTFALLLRRRPPAREAGFILAVSGLGAASLTWLMGIISTQVNSLRIAMVVPFLAAAGLLAVSFWMPCPDTADDPLPALDNPLSAPH
jgi:FHS family glucose/mannose:H+ symporter-like MFS transporter